MTSRSHSLLNLAHRNLQTLCMKWKQHPLLSLSPSLPLPFSASVQLRAAGLSVKVPNSLDETWSINVSPAIRKRVHVNGSNSQSKAVGAPLSDVNNSSGAGSGTVWGQIDPTRHLPPPSTNLSHLPNFSVTHTPAHFYPPFPLFPSPQHTPSSTQFILLYFHMTSRNPRILELNWLNCMCSMCLFKWRFYLSVFVPIDWLTYWLLGSLGFKSKPQTNRNQGKSLCATLTTIVSRPSLWEAFHPSLNVAIQNSY